MKRITAGIINTGIIVILLAGLLAWPEPAMAGVSEWSAETIPDTTGNLLGPAGIDVRNFAVGEDNQTIYAVPGDSIAAFVVYKSIDGGYTWTAITVPAQADIIAVAPDDPNLVLFANATAPEVYVSINGGLSWDSLSLSTTTAAWGIIDIAISPERMGKHYFAAAGMEAGPVANMWYYTYGDFVPEWKSSRILPGFAAQSAIAAIAFSPNFAADGALLAVTSQLFAQMTLQAMDFGSLAWNASSYFTGYPCTITSIIGNSLNSASISLAPYYDGTDETSRDLFIGLSLPAPDVAVSGIYRFEDTVKTNILLNTHIHSLALNGSTLVAGAFDSTTVYRVASALSITPTVTTYLNTSTKSPGGDDRVMLAWIGSTLTAGTSGNESAFSISGNYGATFTDIGLIDTVVTNITDVAVTSTAAKTYLVTDDGADTSLWYKTSGNWVRVLSLKAPAPTGYLIRIERVSGSVVYLAQKGSVSQTIYCNSSSGTALWQIRSCNINIQDIAVESAAVVYVLNAVGKIAKSINAGQTWSISVDTTLASGNMLLSISTGKLLAGSQNGYIAYSFDSAVTWTKINIPFDPAAGKMQVVPDQNFSTNKIIYAASQTAGLDIKKWQIDVSTDWTDIFLGGVTGGIYGLAVNSNTLYALELNAGQSKLWRYITPSTATATATDWVDIGVTPTTEAGIIPFILNSEPQALKVSAGKLWAIRTNLTSKLLSFTDSVTGLKMTLDRPDTGFSGGVNTITGIAYDVVFVWNRPGIASEYQMLVSLDKEFTSVLTTITITSTQNPVSVFIGPSQAGANNINFQPGGVYYWKIRITKPGYSLFSETRSFSIEPLPAAPAFSFILNGPANGAVLTTNTPSFSWQPLQGTVEYEFLLSENPDMSAPLLNAKVNTTAIHVLRKLESNKTYFWWVRATKPIESDWSPAGNFMVAGSAASASPSVQPVPTTTYTMTVPVPTQTEVVVLPAKETVIQTVPGYLYIIILLGLALTGAAVYLIFRQSDNPVLVKESSGPERRGAVKRPVTPGTRPAGTAVRPPSPTDKPLSPKETPKAVWPSAAAKIPSPPPSVPEKMPDVQPSLPKSKDADTIIFAAKSFMWLSSSEGAAATETADKDRESLGKKLASGIRELAKKEPIYIRHPEDAAMLLRLWAHYGSRDETSKYLAASFKSRPENAVRLLKCYLVQSLSGQDGETATFNRESYQALAEVIDADKVYAALTKSSKFKLNTDEHAAPADPAGHGIMSQFMRLHLQERNTG